MSVAVVVTIVVVVVVEEASGAAGIRYRAGVGVQRARNPMARWPVAPRDSPRGSTKSRQDTA